MGDHDITPTCLTDRRHGPKEILDKLTHFTGCIDISERATFLNADHPVWDYERELVQQKRPRATDVEIEEEVQKKIQALAGSIYGQYRRTAIVRAAIRSQSSSSLPTGDKVDKEACPDESDVNSDVEKGVKKNFRKLQKPKDISHLVKCVEDSLTKWRASRRYQTGIAKVRTWREQKGKPVKGPSILDELGVVRSKLSATKHRDSGVGLPVSMDSKDEYELEKDLNGYVIQFKVAADTSAQDTQAGDDTASTSGASQRLPLLSAYVPADCSSPKVKGHFPDQRLPLSDLLDPKNWDMLSGEGIQYIHIPCNNMRYAEEIIAKYYRDPVPTYDGIHRDKPNKTRTEMILRPDYWRGQQHGGRSAVVHARHMRPICEIVSATTGAIDLEDPPSNLVTYMPYLHWETDRNRSKVARVIDEETEKHELLVRYDNAIRKKRREKHRHYLQWGEDDKVKHKAEKNVLWDTEDEDDAAPTGIPHTASDVITGGINHMHLEDLKDEKKRKKRNKYKTPVDHNGRLQPKHKLGQYLIDVARLYEAMSVFRDQKLLEKYLHHDPPLHPRRTLDQSYYRTLKTTKARDRDQVVYRGTTMDLELAHHFGRKEKRSVWSMCPHGILDRTSQSDNGGGGGVGSGGRQRTPDEEQAQPVMNGGPPGQEPKSDSRPPSRLALTRHLLRGKSGPAPVDCEVDDDQVFRPKKWEWKEHYENHDEFGCDECRGGIRKISRVVMVDQLWMWILDNRTIVTCFPRRYGVNKHDPSGVHKSIRQRLKNARKKSIRSVFDLALIILDECSNTFFDRTKTRDRQPQVIDLFSEAIGKVSHKQTILSDRLWHWTKQAKIMYRSKSKHAASTDFHAPLLDISQEGKLQREIKDIIDELDIMLHIHHRQREVLQRYVKLVERILDDEGDDAAPEWDAEDSPPVLKRRKTTGPGGKTADEEDPEQRKKRDIHNWFRINAHELLNDLKERICELEGLKTSADSTAKSVTDLLDLKQQQASVVQAWQSVKQGEETVRQGRSIMMFTLVTIVFLPLSFMSSIFGMNNSTFTPNDDQDGSPMLLQDQIRLMFLVAAGVIVVSLVIAFRGFSRSVRAISYSAWIFCITWLGVTFRVYKLWLVISEALDSDEVVKKTEKRVQKLKDGVRQKRNKAKAKRTLKKMKKRRKENTPKVLGAAVGAPAAVVTAVPAPVAAAAVAGAGGVDAHDLQHHEQGAGSPQPRAQTSPALGPPPRSAAGSVAGDRPAPAPAPGVGVAPPTAATVPSSSNLAVPGMLAGVGAWEAGSGEARPGPPHLYTAPLPTLAPFPSPGLPSSSSAQPSPLDSSSAAGPDRVPVAGPSARRRDNGLLLRDETQLTPSLTKTTTTTTGGEGTTPRASSQALLDDSDPPRPG